MGQKTALKLMLSRWGTLSIEMQEAVASDQGVIKLNGDSEEIEYIDNKDEPEEVNNPFVDAEIIAESPFGDADADTK